MSARTDTRKPATPLPWIAGPLFNQDSRALFWDDTSKPGKWTRRVDPDRNGAFSAMDAAFIVHACNNHARLIAALRFYATGGHLFSDGKDIYSDESGEVARALLTELEVE